MEPIPEKHCFICFESHNFHNLIDFSCKHSYCKKCSPYLLLNSLKFPKELFQNTENQYFCPICLSGNAIIPLETFQKLLTETTQRLCDICKENPATTSCPVCDQVFCEAHFECIHKIKKILKCFIFCF